VRLRFERVLLMGLPGPGLLPALDWTGWHTRYLFFTGKCGVGRLGVGNQRLVVNGLLSEPDDDSAALAFAQRQTVALAGAPAQLAAFPAPLPSAHTSTVSSSCPSGHGWSAGSASRRSEPPGCARSRPAAP
jgi:hypothetical protein